MSLPKFVRAGVSGDAKKPAQTPWGCAFRLPISITVPPAHDVNNPGRMKVKLGVSCDAALVVWPSQNIADHGLEAERDLTVVMPGEEVSIVLVNRSTAAAQIMEGLSLVNGSFMVQNGFESF